MSTQACKRTPLDTSVKGTMQGRRRRSGRSVERRTTVLAEYAISRITFFAFSAGSVVLTCDLNPSNHQKCRVLLIRLSLTHVVARVITIDIAKV